MDFSAPPIGHPFYGRPPCFFVRILKIVSSSVFKVFQYTMSGAVRSIHTQAQAQAELERLRCIDRARYARNKQRRQQEMELQTNPTLDHDIIGRRKRRGIQCDVFQVDPNTDADRKATTREAQKRRRLEQSAEERADLLEKIQQRY